MNKLFLEQVLSLQGICKSPKQCNTELFCRCLVSVEESCMFVFLPGASGKSQNCCYCLSEANASVCIGNKTEPQGLLTAAVTTF